jgi:hypothetical protein
MSLATKTAAKSLIATFAEMDAETREGLMGAIREAAGDIAGDTPEEVVALTASADAIDALSAVTASAGGSRIRRMARVLGQPTRNPEAARQNGGAVLVAARSWEGVTAGQEITDRYQLAAGLARVLEQMPRKGPPQGRALVASAHWTYPDDRTLTTDQARNVRIMDAVCHPTALVASGGVCAPVNVDYAIATWSDASRPLRDGLPAFQIDRGGLTYVQSPVMSSLAGATTVWTEATDASPGASTKPVIQIVCGGPVTVYADAIPTRLGFGNLMARFSPEQLAASVDLAAAAAARIAENNLLSRLAAACTADVTTAILLGATRDLLTAVNQAAAAVRSVHRIARTTMLTAIFPDWLRDLIRVDLAREIGHSQNADWNSLSVTDEQIDGLLQASGVNPIWHMDGQPVNGSVYPTQLFTTQGASGAIETFPAKCVWYLFPEGSVQFLDGGRLDLGIVRDSVLDSTNDAEMFLEPFEGLAFRGFTGAATQFVSSLCANGGSAGTISTASACA